MPEHWGRMIGGITALAALWIIVYWWWEPARPGISFDESPGLRSGETLAAGEPASPATGPAPRPLAVIPPSFRTYTVAPGDTWESIATRELGSPRRITDLTRANPLTTDLRAGRQIRVPLDPANIQGRPVADPPPPAPPGNDVEYTVKRGDTLGAIAKAYYGHSSYKDLIFRANRDRLADEDSLKVGQQLRLPPKPK